MSETVTQICALLVKNIVYLPDLVLERLIDVLDGEQVRRRFSRRDTDGDVG